MRDREDRDRGEPEDKFLQQEDLYDPHSGTDLSNDPMVAPESRKPKGRKPKGRRARKEAKRELKYAAYIERERESIKAEILAELEAEQRGELGGEKSVEEQGSGRRGRRYLERGEEPQAQSRPRHSRLSEYVMSFLSGNILSRSEVRKVYPYLIFLSCLAFIYIANVFNMQQLYHKREQLTEQVKELRAKSMTVASKRMSATRQSYIISEIDRRGLPLHESLSPNKVIED